MKHRILLAWCVVGVLALSSSALAQDDPMAAFKPLVGTWKAATVINPSLANPEKIMGSGEIVVKTILNDKFLRYEGVGTSPRGRLEYHALMTYDEKQKTYRRWVFRSDGIVAESTGVWDADKKTFTWTPVGLPPNVTFTATTTITEDGFKETLHGKRADGMVTMDLITLATKKP